MAWLALAMGVMALAALLLWRRARVRRALAERAERLALERRDRFLATAARELEAPLAALRTQADPARATPERMGALARGLDELRGLVAELGRLPAHARAVLDDVDLAELVRDVLGAPPFVDRGPSVVLRASETRVRGDRARLASGLRVLLWVMRRQLGPEAPMVVTVSGDEESAFVEIDTRGGEELVDAFERLPGVIAGLDEPSAPTGALLALRVAQTMARAHGGRLSAGARVGQGQRWVVELPRQATAAAPLPLA
jgi:signal transduction histidine kinase